MRINTKLFIQDPEVYGWTAVTIGNTMKVCTLKVRPYYQADQNWSVQKYGNTNIQGLRLITF